ncbi:MAG: AraC family transcriptional regulator [Alphaproteobacteria bacterium]|nr:AraC family transcriptional regulator [Alphaproteobacteria bacterium]
MLATGEIGSHYVRGFLQGAVGQGHDPAALLERAGIHKRAYYDEDATVTGAELQRLILTLSRALNDEHLGFLAIRAKLAMGRLVGETALDCATLGPALRKMTRLINAVRHDMEITLRFDETSETIAFEYEVTGFNTDIDPHFFYWFKLYWAYKFLSWLIGERIQLTQVSFSAEELQGGIEGEKLFGCPVLYGQPSNGLLFPLAFANRPVIRTRSELRDGAFFCAHPDWFTVPARNQPFSKRIERLLTDMYMEGLQVPSLDLLGRLLRCSPRTISRKLAEEQSSLQKLKDTVRRSIADQLLVETDLTVAEIAEKVGFAEPSDFTRAYISWTGEPPSQCRKRLRLRSAPPRQ